MASSITFHESFGEVTRAQLAAYRKHNVSPSDHDFLVERFGDDHALLTQIVKDYSPGGMFSIYAALTA